MRIISKFHDFYDRAIGFGIDPKLIFMREQLETIPAPKTVPHVFPPTNGWNSLCRHWACNVQKGYLSFCGLVYPFFSLPPKAYGKPRKIFWTMDAFIESIAGR